MLMRCALKRPQMLSDDVFVSNVRACGNSMRRHLNDWSVEQTEKRKFINDKLWKMERVAYIFSDELIKQCNKIPVLRGRVSIPTDLMTE